MEIVVLSLVALLYDTQGVSINDKDILLPRGQVGKIIEAQDPNVVIVEFANLDGIAFALASVACENLLKLHHGEDVPDRQVAVKLL